MLLFSGVILAVIAVVAGLWLAVGDGRKTGVSNPAESPAGPGRDVSKPRKADGGQKTGVGGSGSDETAVSGSHRQPLQFRSKPVEPAAVLAVLATGKETVVRDYIMQHLGHLWEQHGAREEIEKTLWQAVATSDQTTPGTALIALSRGYERDGETENLAKVRHQALALAQNPTTPLPVRVTALSIAGDGGGEEVKQLAGKLVGNSETPAILKKVAERLVR
jgi:hypothetical protein